MRGHEVTVATTKLPTRLFSKLNGVTIREFKVSGNLVRGMEGNVAEYRRFVTTQPFDVIMVKAAQQWTFDAMWPVLSEIKAGKVFVPCGFSGLYEPAYAEYFRQLPRILQQFGHLIFYASDYRDINFAKGHGISRFSIIPNGASEVEFSVDPDRCFRQRHSIGSDDLLFLTVGSLSRVKGHLDVATAFLSAELDGHPATLILNGNESVPVEWKSTVRVLQGKCREYTRIVLDSYGKDGLLCASKYLLHGVLNKGGIRRGKYTSKGMAHDVTFKEELLAVMAEVGRQGSNKRVVVTDLPRSELVQAYMNSDLFVFASHVEYSPLVLFESAAAGTPFLSVPVGNSVEIARWTGAGVICPAPQDGNGYTKVDSEVLGEYWSRLAKDRAYLSQLGAAGKAKWAEQFTWRDITDKYEQVFQKVSTDE
ncbi:MAG: D-inositol-3-phosphate glycosyltransferase [Nitrosomonadaceae bacterium]|nr:D-inositol-3-phosphate glycosyltransferase [Nitrosomonadaceae bacterium]